MAAFALSRLVFRGRNVAFLLIILGIMIPTQVLIIPIFQELNAVNLLNTYWSVIFPQVPAVIAVFIFKQFFDGIPRELEEAARIDGASIWKVYWSVILPLSRPVIAAVTILTFVGVWNNLLLPLFVLSNPDLMTSRSVWRRSRAASAALRRHPGGRVARSPAADHPLPGLPAADRRGRDRLRPSGLTPPRDGRRPGASWHRASRSWPVGQARTCVRSCFQKPLK